MDDIQQAAGGALDRITDTVIGFADAIPLWALFSTLGILIAFWVGWHIWKQGHRLGALEAHARGNEEAADNAAAAITGIQQDVREIAQLIEVDRNPTLRYELYKDARKEWRWKSIARNGEVIGVSAEGYTTKRACQHSVRLHKGTAPPPKE